MDLIFDWNLGNMIYNDLITLRRCGFPFAEIGVVSEGVQEGAMHNDDAVWSQHLQLQVGVVRDRHELGIAWPPQDGVVRP